MKKVILLLFILALSVSYTNGQTVTRPDFIDPGIYPGYRSTIDTIMIITEKNFRKGLAQTIGEFFTQAKPETIYAKDRGQQWFWVPDKYDGYFTPFIVSPPDSSLSAFYRWLIK